MKKRIKSISFIFFILIIVFGLQNVVHANSIYSIDMDIYIDTEGNAEVTEIWNCKTNQGTEAYHPFYNLGESKITDLKVYKGNQLYTTLADWNTSGTLDSKAYKCGINYLSNGLELCWGISEYGTSKYTVEYKISNFVSQVDDCQMIYWTLIPYEFSDEIQDVQIVIHSDKSFEDTIDVWGYGNYGGLCYVSNGKIYMSSEGVLEKSEYMTILAKFPTGMFNTTNSIKGDFEQFFKMAEDNAIKYSEDDKISGIAAFFTTLILGLFFYCSIRKFLNNTNRSYGFKYGEAGRKFPKDIAYFRDIPCNGDIFRAYYIAYQYGIAKNETDILGAIILKWVKEGVVRAENKEGGKIFKKENTVIVLGDNPNKELKNERETELFGMLYKASKDGVLESKEFEKWCKNNYSKIYNWFDKILREERKQLVDSGLIINTKNGRIDNEFNIATQMLKDEAIEISGFKKFLLDYTLIAEREAIEVELFEDYLIYAEMLGIADKVAKQFKELYPNMIEQTNYNSYDNLLYINLYTAAGMSRANSARAAAQSYSSGGGGFSSGGGGGGSFGGGGGRRRFPLIYGGRMPDVRDRMWVYCFFIFGFEIREAIYPKKMAAAMPPAAAAVPPVNAPINPLDSAFWIAPFASKFPKPVKGTVAPQPAKSTSF